MNIADITQQIRGYAINELKFNLFGVARARPLPIEYEHLKFWCSSSYNAGLRWMQDTLEVRTQPQKLLNNCKSIIVVAASYLFKLPLPNLDSGGQARLEIANNRVLIARYGWVTDYHRAVKERLKQLVDYIRTLQPTSACYVSVDSEPVLEKFWAVQAGIGWQGKNSLVINPELGSWFCLGVVLTDIELEYSAPLFDQCGNCSKCIDACPTKAIVADKLVDASKCISYMNIEEPRLTANPAPTDVCGWGFGCDICQEVCPYNHRLASKAFEGFELISEAIDPDREYWEWINDNPVEYKNVYKLCPLKRRRLKS